MPIGHTVKKKEAIAEQERTGRETLCQGERVTQAEEEGITTVERPGDTARADDGTWGGAFADADATAWDRWVGSGRRPTGTAAPGTETRPETRPKSTWKVEETTPKW